VIAVVLAATVFMRPPARDTTPQTDALSDADAVNLAKTAA
jgi:hypothetical protein